MTPTSPRRGVPAIVYVAGAVAIVALVASLGIFSSGSTLISTSSATGPTFCQGVTVAARYAQDQPRATTIQQLSALVAHLRNQYASIPRAPASQAPTLRLAVSAGNRLLEDLANVQSGKPMTPALRQRGLADIREWQRTTKALTHWSTLHC